MFDDSTMVRSRPSGVPQFGLPDGRRNYFSLIRCRTGQRRNAAPLSMPIFFQGGRTQWSLP